jgi:hypothetical protein
MSGTTTQKLESALLCQGGKRVSETRTGDEGNRALYFICGFSSMQEHREREREMCVL